MSSNLTHKKIFDPFWINKWVIFSIHIFELNKNRLKDCSTDCCYFILWNSKSLWVFGSLIASQLFFFIFTALVGTYYEIVCRFFGKIHYFRIFSSLPYWTEYYSGECSMLRICPNWMMVWAIEPITPLFLHHGAEFGYLF